MKKIVYVAALAALICACSKFESQKEVTDSSLVKVTFSAEPSDTKFSLGTLKDGKYPVRWNKSEGGEKARIYERRDGKFDSSKILSDSYYPSGDGVTAAFSFTLPVVDSASSYEYYSITPDTYSFASENDKLVRAAITKAHTQIPSVNSPDKVAMPLLACGGTFTSQQMALSGSYEFMGAIGKMTIKNYGGAATATNISISFDDKEYVLGLLDYNVDTGVCSLVKSTFHSDKVININPKNLTLNSSEFDVWFGIPAQTIAAGERITVTIDSSSGSYSKTCTIPAGHPLAFTRGHVTGFTVNMSGIAPALQTKTLTFDFINTDSSKLPTAASTSLSDEYKNFTWPADDGNSYQFYNAGYFYHGATATNAMLSAGTEGSVFAYLGLPAISGYKLTTVALQRAYSSERQVEITSACPIGSTVSITGTVVVTVANPSIDLAGKTESGKMYYLRALVCSNNYVDIKKIILTYTAE